jgi:tagaturonate reductase
MKKLNREHAGLENKLTIKIIQFGEGNFLRAFIDYAFQQLNKEANFNGGIAVVQPIDKGLINVLNSQDGLYTLFMKGVKKGKVIENIELISNIVKGVDPYQNFNEYISLAKEETLEFIISNTTESGIAYESTDTLTMQPPTSFPAKLTVLLYERFKHFNGAADKGVTIIPCELINYNSDTLKDIILKYIDDWSLGAFFKTWILRYCSFHNTLVDRIVPGYPKDEIEMYNSQLQYQDNLIVTAETFFLWVIEGGNELKEKLPFHTTDLDVKIVSDMQPYRTRKVRILNGAHTAMVPMSLLYGNITVKESVDNSFTGSFINTLVFNEINETLKMEKEELNSFAEEVFDRFRNPFIKHQLADIALNSISKFKVRVLPSLIEYIAIFDKIPTNLTFAFACLIRFYKGEWQNNTLPINDSDAVIKNFKEIWSLNDYQKIVSEVLSNEEFWEQNLSTINGLADALTFALKEIDKNGVEKAFHNFNTIY